MAVLVTNLYVAQPLILDIAAALRIEPELAGSVISASQFGYGIGLLLLVPLSDIVENRRLVLICGGVALAGTIGLALATSAALFLFCALLVGIFSSGAQVLLPFLTHILPPERRGGALGAIMAGVLGAVMLARPFALFVAGTLGWRAIYLILAVATFTLGLALMRVMPRRVPDYRASYASTIASMPMLLWHERAVVRRTLYQAALFAVFTMFWAVVPIVLAQHFHLSHVSIGLFALAGVGGAAASPLAGRAADRGYQRIGTVLACLVIALSWFAAIPLVWYLLLIPMALIAILIDGGVQTAQTFSRLIVLGVAPERRGRVNALYMTIVYTSGAMGSIIGVSLYMAWGWNAVAAAGGVLAGIVGIAAAAER